MKTVGIVTLFSTEAIDLELLSLNPTFIDIIEPIPKKPKRIRQDLFRKCLHL